MWVRKSFKSLNNVAVLHFNCGKFNNFIIDVDNLWSSASKQHKWRLPNQGLFIERNGYPIIY